MNEIRPIEWEKGTLALLDQTLLPLEHVTLRLHDYREVVKAIKEMRVRGAPAIGVVAAYAMAMAAAEIDSDDWGEFRARLEDVGQEITSARPTAINITWAVQRMLKLTEIESNTSDMASNLTEEAILIHEEDERANRRLGQLGMELLPDTGGVLTHCNAGSLATAGYGTALGVIRSAWEDGKRFHVFNTETRPFLQGSRLTAWELLTLGIPSTLIVDSSAGLFMKQGNINCVVVGADRIAANGDVANKIGTYSLAVLAKENGVPFYVAAPISTVDINTDSGEGIPIEERPVDEVIMFAGVHIAPDGIGVRNPAFDVTPHKYVTAIITEMGIVKPPYSDNLSIAVHASGRASNV